MSTPVCRNRLTLVCALLAPGAIAQNANAQNATASSANIPVRSVTTPVMSAEPFKTVPPDVRHLPSGRVLVNDLRGKRLIVFDSTFTTFTISADSSSSTGVLYPYTGLRSPLIRYLADSALFPDFQAQTYLLIEPTGKVGRAVAPPKARDLSAVSVPYAGSPASDNLGRLIYRATSFGVAQRPGDPPSTATRDTIPLVRADFNTRTIDTIGSFTTPRQTSVVITDGPNGKPVGVRTVNPLPQGPDEWTVTSEGLLAVVRAHDYHIDWILPDGTKTSTPKMPYDWKRLTDEDKVARIDSMKRFLDSVSASGRPSMYIRGRAGTDRADTIYPTVKYVPLSEIADYVPPLRQGSVKSDEDGNIWILPTTSAQVGSGLLYDVINKSGVLFERVRMPAGFVLIGFGKGGMVYLGQNSAATSTWLLGRARVVRPPP